MVVFPFKTADFKNFKISSTDGVQSVAAHHRTKSGISINNAILITALIN